MVSLAIERKAKQRQINQVKYWALGNEVWGPWQVEQTTKEAYAQKAYQWAKGRRMIWCREA